MGGREGGPENHPAPLPYTPNTHAAWQLIEQGKKAQLENELRIAFPDAVLL